MTARHYIWTPHPGDTARPQRWLEGRAFPSSAPLVPPSGPPRTPLSARPAQETLCLPEATGLISQGPHGPPTPPRAPALGSPPPTRPTNSLSPSRLPLPSVPLLSVLPRLALGATLSGGGQGPGTACTTEQRVAAGLRLGAEPQCFSPANWVQWSPVRASRCERPCPVQAVTARLRSPQGPRTPCLHGTLATQLQASLRL